MLYLAIIALCILAIGLSIVLMLVTKGLRDSEDDLIEAMKSYYALEKGMDEQADGFHQERLTFEETIKTQDASLKSRDRDIQILMTVSEYHADNCLPDYAPMLGEEAYETMNFYSVSHEKYDAELLRLRERDDSVSQR